MNTRNGGFTLVELVVVFSLFLLISLGVGYTLSQMRKSAQPGLSDRLGLQMEARMTAAKINILVRECGAVIRPLLGETSSRLVMKDIVNNIAVLYLDNDEKNSKLFKKKVYKLVSYTYDHGTSFRKENEKVIVDAVKRLTFTSTSPFSVSVNATLVSPKGEFQFVTLIGLLNLGDLDQ